MRTKVMGCLSGCIAARSREPLDTETLFPHLRRVGVALLVLVLLALGKLPAYAFKGAEHRDLSNLALDVVLREIAAERPEQEAVLEKLRSDLLDENRACELFASERGTDFTFGDVTAAMDYAAHLEKFLPTLADCYQRRRAGRDACAALTSADPARTLQVLNQEVERVLGRKCLRGLFVRLLAAHRNQRHFDEDAATSYNSYHELALASAKRLTPGSSLSASEGVRLTLLQEAMALHFLHDFLAPGHLMTRRHYHDDVSSRWLHNHYNRLGLPAHFTLAEDDERALSELCAQASPGASDDQPAWIGECKAAPIACDRRRQELCAAATEPIACTFGDGRLDTSATSTQTRALFALSVRSIREVLRTALDALSPVPATAAAAASLQLCHQPWSAERQAKLDEPDLKHTFPPHGFVLITRGLPVSDCYRGLRRAVDEPPARLLVDVPAGGEVQLDDQRCEPTDPLHHAEIISKTNFEHVLTGVSLAYARLFPFEGGGVRSTGIDREEADLLIGAVSTRGVKRRDAEGPLADEFPGKSRLLKNDLAMLVFLGARRESWPNLEARSLSLGFQQPFRFGDLQWNHYYRFAVGLTEYRLDGRSPRKVDYGLRYGFGMGIAYLELGVDRGFQRTAPRTLQRQTTLSLGIRVQYPLPF